MGLSDRERELVAIGASVGSNCLPCFRFHFAEAIKTGLSHHEIEEAVRLSQTVKQRPGVDMDRLTRDLFGRESERAGDSDINQIATNN